jgi:hypothetical protein
MAPNVHIDVPLMGVVPGQDAVWTVRIRNTSELVDAFAVTVLGPAAAWTTVMPGAVQLFPGDRGLVTVHFRPPATLQAPPGPLPVAIKVTSLSSPVESVVYEAPLEIGPLVHIEGWLRPVSVRYRRTARHRAVVHNAGNVAVPVALAGLDGTERLQFGFDEPAATLSPGEQRELGVEVRSRPTVRGPTETQPFQVLVLRGDRLSDDDLAEDRALLSTLDGLDLRRPLVGAWLFRMLGILAILAAVFAFVILREDHTELGEPDPLGPPPTPAALAATATGPTTVRLTWIDAGGEDALQLFQRPVDAPAVTTVLGRTDAATDAVSRCPGCTPVAQLAADTTSFDVTGLQPGSTTCYAVLSLRKGVASFPTEDACATTPQPPTAQVAHAPVEVVAAPVSPGVVQVTWTDTNANTTTYEVAQNGQVKQATVPGATSLMVEGLPAGQFACFQVRAVKTEPASTSELVPATPGACVLVPPPLKPCPPTKLKAASVSPGPADETGTLQLTWSVEDHAQGANGPESCTALPPVTFEVQQLAGPGQGQQVATAPAADRAVAVHGLVFGQLYCYRIRAVSGDAASPYAPATGQVCAVVPIPGEGTETSVPPLVPTP